MNILRLKILNSKLCQYYISERLMRGDNMLKGKSTVVLHYLQAYFKENNKPITVFDVDIKNISMSDVERAFEDLNKHGLIKLNENYIYPSVEGLIEKSRNY